MMENFISLVEIYRTIGLRGKLCYYIDYTIAKFEIKIEKEKKKKEEES